MKSDTAYGGSQYLDITPPDSTRKQKDYKRRSLSAKISRHLFRRSESPEPENRKVKLKGRTSSSSFRRSPSIDKAALEEKRISEVRFEPMNSAEFVSEYKRKLKDDLLQYEFKALQRTDTSHQQKCGYLEINRFKNVINASIPYDHCRVKLGLSYPPGIDDTDYINASYVNWPDKKRASHQYIVTQGHLAGTVNDLWKMIWQEKITHIVMLTSIFVYSKQECEQYWHETYNLYGDIQVQTSSTLKTCNYTIRTFTVSKIGSSDSRTIYHYQYHTWTERELPDISALLEFQRLVKTSIAPNSPPILVQCSDGSGRSGAYITLDITLHTLVKDGYLDLLSTIQYLRTYRPNIVSNLSQLQTLYEALYIKIVCGTTVVPVEALDTLIRQLSNTDPVTRLTGFEQELKVLHTVVDRIEIGDCAGGHRAENRRKSRDIMIQPPERSRPYLMTFDSSESSDFINAVYVNGFNQVNEFIVTQWPLKTTVNDIWRLVFDKHVSVAVILHDHFPSKTYPEFWPSQEGVKTRFGPVSVTRIYTEDNSQFRVQAFTVKKALFTDRFGRSQKHKLPKESLSTPNDIYYNSEVRTIRLIFLKSWPDSCRTPAHSSVLLEAINMARFWKQTFLAGTPILVMSKNGVSRAGVFCSAAICLDQIRSLGEVDPFNAIKTVKQNRPQLVENIAEYKSIYKFAASIIRQEASQSNLLNLPIHLSETSESTHQSNELTSNSSFNEIQAASPNSRLPTSLLDSSFSKPQRIYSKGFVHYALPIDLVVHEAEEISEEDDDTSSNKSSFIMDSEVLNAETKELLDYENNSFQNYSF